MDRIRSLYPPSAGAFPLVIAALAVSFITYALCVQHASVSAGFPIFFGQAPSLLVAQIDSGTVPRPGSSSSLVPPTVAPLDATRNAVPEDMSGEAGWPGSDPGSRLVQALGEALCVAPLWRAIKAFCGPFPSRGPSVVPPLTMKRLPQAPGDADRLGDTETDFGRL